jgi:AraC-like DNA-binding protein
VPEALKQHFAAVWMHRLPVDAPERVAVVPDGCIDLQWVDGELRIAGPDREVNLERLRPGATVIGFRFQPAAASQWLALPMTEIVGARLPLRELWGGEAQQIIECVGDSSDPRVISRFLADALARKSAKIAPPDQCLQAVYHFLNDAPSVRDLSSRIGWSERTLRRRCEESFGYGPKMLARIRRFQRFLKLSRLQGSLSAAALAMEAGYFDQPHLNRETLHLAGMTPTELQAQLLS